MRMLLINEGTGGVEYGLGRTNLYHEESKRAPLGGKATLKGQAEEGKPADQQVTGSGESPTVEAAAAENGVKFTEGATKTQSSRDTQTRAEKYPVDWEITRFKDKTQI